MTSESNIKNNSLQITDLFLVFRTKWYWFVLSLALSIGVMYYFIQRTSPQYKRSASILIKDETQGGNIGGVTADVIADLGFFQSRVNVQNELLIIQAPVIIEEAVKRLSLNERYLIKKGLRYIDLYKKNPVSVSFQDKLENTYVSYAIHIISEKKYEIIDIYFNNEHFSLKENIKGEFGKVVNTGVNKLSISATPFMNKTFVGQNIYYSNIPVTIAANNLSERIKFELGNKVATIIDLSINDVSIQRGDDILNTLIDIYGEAWIKDKNQIAESTSKFINERLGLIERELGNVDNDISTYKSENLMPDAKAVSNKLLEQSSQNDAQILELSTKYSMSQYIKEYMQKPSRQEQLIPANSGIDSKVETQIIEYNSKLLERNSILSNSSSQNPLVKDLDNSLKSMRKTILLSIDDLIEITEIQLDKVYQSESITKKDIAQNPTQVKYLLSVERQQKIKESLYLFLLQKREENELTYAFTAYNTRLVSPPMGNIIPVFPNKNKFFFIALLIGFIVPCIVLLTLEGLNTNVKSRKDLKDLSIPLISEIPWASKKAYYLYFPLFFLRKKNKNELNIIVSNKSRDRVNEAFRIARTNIDFMHENTQNGSVMMITSSNPNSGKSFITTNLAICISIRGSRVLIIDFDLRKATASTIVGSPRVGVSDYLAGKEHDLDKIIIKSKDYENLDILPVGKIPPNPSELLASPKLKELISSLKPFYDHILLDCTPIDIVADAALVNKVCDTAIFVIRAGLFARRDLPYIQELYDSKTYNNIRVILNNSDVYGQYSHRKHLKYSYYVQK